MILRIIAFLLGLRSLCYYRGDGYRIVAKNVALNVRTCVDLLASEAFLSIRNLTDRPVSIVFQDEPDDGVNIKVFRRGSRYFITVCDPKPEVGLARGLDALWRYLANVGPDSR